MRVTVIVQCEHGNYSASYASSTHDTELDEMAHGLMHAGGGAAMAMGFCPSDIHAIFECGHCGSSPWESVKREKEDADE